MKTNTKTKKKSVFTQEGAKAPNIHAEEQLRRSVMANLLWEDTFYEDGVSVVDRIQALIPLVKAEKVAQIAVEARQKMNLRHVPLLIAAAMTQHKPHHLEVRKLLPQIILRPDELSEFVAILWGKKRYSSLGHGVKKGLAEAFGKFSEYALAKYNNQDRKVKLRDVLFLCHAKPANPEQETLWKKLIDGQLTTPDTWETNLSAGKDKKATWERLITEKKLGALAYLRNLRNMNKAKVQDQIILNGMKDLNIEKVLPFRFITAARYAPQWESALEELMFKCLEKHEKLKGRTVVLLDVSSSMDVTISQKSELTRLDAACGLGMLLREICESVEVFTFSDRCVLVPARRGFALRDAVVHSQPHSSTLTGEALKLIHRTTHYDRIIVLSDEQSHDEIPVPLGKGYFINVATYQYGIGYGKWLHVDGWSEAIIEYTRTFENAGN